MTDTTSKWVPALPRPTRPPAQPAATNGSANGAAAPVEVEQDQVEQDEIEQDQVEQDQVEQDQVEQDEIEEDVEVGDDVAIDDDVAVEEVEEVEDITVEHTETVEHQAEEVTDEDGEDEQAPPPPADDAPADGTKHRIDVGSVVRRGIRIFALAVIAFALFAFFLSGLAQGRSQVGLQRRFRSELASNAAPVGGAIPTGVPVAMIEIRGIGLHEAVVEGSRSSQLREGPGHVLGTPLPGQPGNTVIAGRKTMYGGPFAHLGSLHPGNRIHMTTGEGNTTYRVTSVHTLGATDGSFVQDHQDNRLTLFTTDSPLAASGRLVVTATLIGNPFPPTVLPRTLDADGLGLTGERNSAPNVLVWLELLAFAALLATFARSRWSSARTWLVFAPAIALLVWLFFESVVRLLPATL